MRLPHPGGPLAWAAGSEAGDTAPWGHVAWCLTARLESHLFLFF